MRRRRTLVEQSIVRLARRLDDLETLARNNRRTLDLQFRRIADIQVQVDRLTAELKRTR